MIPTPYPRAGPGPFAAFAAPRRLLEIEGFLDHCSHFVVIRAQSAAAFFGPHYPAMGASVQRIKFADLSRATGVSEKWWRRRLDVLKDLGLLTQRGRVWFGDLSALLGWIGAQNPAADLTRQRQLDRALALVEGVAEETRDADLVEAASILRTWG